MVNGGFNEWQLLESRMGFAGGGRFEKVSLKIQSF